MKTTYKLKEVMVPENHVLDRMEKQTGKKEKDRTTKSNVFMSSEFHNPSTEQKLLNRSKTALVLMMGTGNARAGMWARTVCNNENFELGSALPQIEWAQMNGYPVIVMNPNQNKVNGKVVPFNQNMTAHCSHIWENYVEPSGFQSLLVLAHSNGGLGLTAIQKKFAHTFYQKVKQIAYTDSKPILAEALDKFQQEFMDARAIHYLASKEPLGAPVLAPANRPTCCPSVSAGHP